MKHIEIETEELMPSPKFKRNDVVVGDFHACCGIVPKWEIIKDPEYKAENTYMGYWYTVKFLGCLTGSINCEVGDESEFSENRLVSLEVGKEMAGKYLESKKTVFQEQLNAFASPLESLSKAHAMKEKFNSFNPDDVAKKQAISEIFAVFGNTKSFLEKELQDCKKELERLQE